MTWSDQRTRIRRYLRDPDANIWSNALLLNLYNDEQAYIASKVPIDEDVQAVRIPGWFQSGYMHDMEYAYSGYATRHPYKFGYYDDKNDYIFLHKWEAEHLESLSSASTSCAGSTYTHPWEAFVSGVTPSEPPPFPLPVDFHSITDLYWDRKPLQPTTLKEIQEQDASWRTHGGYPTHYYRHDELEDWIYLWPIPSRVDNTPTNGLLTNPDFTKGTFGWSALNGATLTTDSDDRLVITENGTTEPGATEIVTLTAGERYEVGGNVQAGTEATYRLYCYDRTTTKHYAAASGEAGTTITKIGPTRFTVPVGSASFNVSMVVYAAKDSGYNFYVNDMYIEHIKGEGDTDESEYSASYGRIDVDNNLLVIFKKETEDFDATDDVSALPSFLTKYIEYGVIARAYRANTDGRIESLADYWDWRKEVGLKILATYRSKRYSARHYQLRTPGIPGRRTYRHPRLPDTAITTS